MDKIRIYWDDESNPSDPGWVVVHEYVVYRLDELDMDDSDDDLREAAEIEIGTDLDADDVEIERGLDWEIVR